jgi:lipid-A-disaccharide synthase
MTTLSTSKKVLIIAGETSGDAHGAELVREIKKLDDTVSFCGIGGEGFKNEGVRVLIDAGELSVVGITEVFSKMPAVLKSFSCVKNILRTDRPDLVILIDFPDFNLAVAKIAKKFKIPVLYYISPQIWAWRSGRISRIKRDVEHMAVILPFEKEYYTAHAIPSTFVGHPLLDYYAGSPAKECSAEDIANPVVGLLPGSRRGEIERNLPEMLAAASQLQQRYKNMEFIVSLAPSISREWMESYIHPYRQTCRISIMSGPMIEILQKSTLVVAVSGTVTLETAIYGVPMVIVYRVSPVSYLLGRVLIRVDHIGLVNIIANERIVPELIQKDANPSKIAQTVGWMLNTPETLSRICEKLKIVRQRLGSPGAASKTAEIALFLLKQHEL